MAKPTFWTDVIPTGPDSSMAGIMGSPETIEKLTAAYKVLLGAIKASCDGLGEDEKARLFNELDNESWTIEIGTGESKIRGLMFGNDKRRDTVADFLNAVRLAFENCVSDDAMANASQAACRSYTRDRPGTVGDDSAAVTESETVTKPAETSGIDPTLQKLEAGQEPVKAKAEPPTSITAQVRQEPVAGTTVKFNTETKQDKPKRRVVKVV